jgi:hypothetical protein
MANYASCGDRGGRNGGRTGGRSTGGRSGSPPASGNDRPQCQICERVNHITPQC